MSKVIFIKCWLHSSLLKTLKNTVRREPKTGRCNLLDIGIVSSSVVTALAAIVTKIHIANVFQVGYIAGGDAVSSIWIYTGNCCNTCSRGVGGTGRNHSVGFSCISTAGNNGRCTVHAASNGFSN